MEQPPLCAAGRVIPSAVDRIRRYCGLSWSGGPPETWAWRYYDTVATAPDDEVIPVDVMCAAALHPGLSRDDLVWFHDHRADLEALLADVPADLVLADLSEHQVDHLASLPDALDGPSVSLVSKVLHRKRPHVIPLIDRHVVDWFRPVTRQRALGGAWGPIVRELWAEGHEDRRNEALAEAIRQVQHDLDHSDEGRGGGTLSWLRAKDIAIWMGSR